MNAYKLNDKSQDQSFISGVPVRGTAVFLRGELDDNSIKVNERIVVLLSNGKKYMGRVTDFSYKVNGEVIEGAIEIVKA